MKYRIVRENRPTLKNYGRYKAVAVHETTVETPQIIREVCRSTGASRGSVLAILIGLAEAVGDHLRRGDRVRLDDWGLLKLEIECAKVDAPEAFSPGEHIRGVRLHFLPESRHGRQPLYHGLRFTREEKKAPEPASVPPRPVPQKTPHTPQPALSAHPQTNQALASPAPRADLPQTASSPPPASACSAPTASGIPRQDWSLIPPCG